MKTRAASLAFSLMVGCSASAGPESAEILVPGGEAIVGANCVLGNVEASCDRSPRNHRESVHFDAFFVDRNLVTRDDYAACVRAGMCVDDDGPRPAGYAERYSKYPEGRYELAKALVRPEAAAVYCKWRGARLLTADEFERVARGTEGRVTPWEHSRNPCRRDRDISIACVTAKGPAGVRAIAYNPQWVDARDKRYPAGMIRGSNDVTFWADNQDMSAYDERWQPTLYAAFRCARSVAPAPSAPSMAVDATGAPPSGW